MKVIMTVFAFLVLLSCSNGLKLRDSSRTDSAEGLVASKMHDMMGELKQVLLNRQPDAYYWAATLAVLRNISGTPPVRHRRIFQSFLASSEKMFQELGAVDLRIFDLLTNTDEKYQGCIKKITETKDVNSALACLLVSWRLAPIYHPVELVNERYMADKVGCKVSYVANTSRFDTLPWLRIGQTQRYGTDIKDVNLDFNVLPGQVFHPKTHAEATEAIKTCEASGTKIVTQGSGLAPGSILNTPNGKPTCIFGVWNFKDVEFDWCAMTLSIGAGVTFEDVSQTLVQFNATVETYPQLKKISIVGFTGIQGNGVLQGMTRNSMVSTCMEMTVVNGKGEIKTIPTNTTAGAAWVQSIGDLGAIIGAKYKLLPDQIVIQRGWVSRKFSDVVHHTTGVFEAWEPYPWDPNDLPGQIAFGITDPGMPTWLYFGDDSRSNNLTAPPVPVNDQPSNVNFFRAIHLKQRFSFIWESLNLIMQWWFSMNHDLEEKVWEICMGQPLPHVDTPQPVQAFIRSIHQQLDFSLNSTDWQPNDAGIFGSFYFHPKWGEPSHKALEKLPDYNRVYTSFMLYSRVFAERYPSYLQHPYCGMSGKCTLELFSGAGSLEMWWISWLPRQVMEQFMGRMLCALKCNVKVPVVAYHFGEVFPTEWIPYEGWNWPSVENLKKFEEVALMEDPNDLFATEVTVIYKKKNEPGPKIDMCKFCEGIAGWQDATA